MVQHMRVCNSLLYSHYTGGCQYYHLVLHGEGTGCQTRAHTLVQDIRILCKIALLHLALGLNTVSNAAEWWSCVVRKAGILEVGSVEKGAEDFHEGVHLTPAIVTSTTLGVALIEWNSALVESEVNIGCHFARIIVVGHGDIVGGWADRLDWLRCGDDLDDKACAKWLHVGNDHLLVCRWAGSRQRLVELGEAESGNDRGDVDIVGEVEVESLVERESGGHLVECGIDGCAVSMVMLAI